MLHEVLHLSSIATANVHQIDPAFLISYSFPERRNNYNWPKKHHVTSTDFTTWRRVVHHIYCFEDSRLHQSLTHWLYPIQPVLRTLRHWCLDNTNNILYETVNETPLSSISPSVDEAKTPISKAPP